MRIVRPATATLLLSMVVVAGCSIAVDRTKLNPPPHPLKKRPASAVEIFMRKAPERPFVEVYLIEAQQEVGAGESNELIGELREEAGRAGCDGLVINGTDKTIFSGGLGLSSSTSKGYRATCIVYR